MRKLYGADDDIFAGCTSTNRQGNQNGHDKNTAMKTFLLLTLIGITICTCAILTGCVHTVTKDSPSSPMLPAAPMLPTVPQ